MFLFKQAVREVDEEDEKMKGEQKEEKETPVPRIHVLLSAQPVWPQLLGRSGSVQYYHGPPALPWQAGRLAGRQVGSPGWAGESGSFSRLRAHDDALLG